MGETGRGGSFGELALLHGTRRAATVKCSAAAVVWALDRTTFRVTMAKEIEREGKVG